MPPSARNACSTSVVAALRWLARGAAIACGSVIPKSRRLTRICSTVVMIVAPPGEPTARNGRLLRRTIVGEIDERGRLLPASWFAPRGLVPSEPRLKSVSSLFSRKP